MAAVAPVVESAKDTVVAQAEKAVAAGTDAAHKAKGAVVAQGENAVAVVAPIAESVQNAAGKAVAAADPKQLLAAGTDAAQKAKDAVVDQASKVAGEATGVVAKAVPGGASDLLGAVTGAVAGVPPAATDAVAGVPPAGVSADPAQPVAPAKDAAHKAEVADVLPGRIGPSDLGALKGLPGQVGPFPAPVSLDPDQMVKNDLPKGVSAKDHFKPGDAADKAGGSRELEVILITHARSQADAFHTEVNDLTSFQVNNLLPPHSGRGTRTGGCLVGGRGREISSSCLY